MRTKKMAVVLTLTVMATVTFVWAGRGWVHDPGDCGCLSTLVADLPLGDVDPTEEADALLMREEEKLARDIYQAMDDLWGLRVLRQIGMSEQRHMDAMLRILEKHGIADPVGSNPPGVGNGYGPGRTAHRHRPGRADR